MEYHEALNPLKLLVESGYNGEEFSRKIADCFPAVVFICDAGTRKLKYINHKVTDYLGYTLDEVESWDNDLLRMVHTEDRQLVSNELARIFSLQHDPYTFKARLIHREGAWRYFRVHSSVVYTAGEPPSVLFVAQDITEEVQAGQKSRRIEELFNDTQEVLRFGVWEWNVQENVMTWSSGLYKLFGYDPVIEKEILAISPAFYLSHVVEEDRKKAVQHPDMVLDQEEYDRYFRIRDRYGRYKDVRDKCRVIRNGHHELVRVIGSTMDVTEQLKLYRDLSEYKKMKQEHEAFLEYGTWEYDVASDRFNWSEGMYRLFGYDAEVYRDKLVINDALYKKHMDEEDYENIYNVRKSMLQKKEENYSWEFRIVTHDGKVKKLETSGRLVYNANGRWVKTIGTSRDITRLREYQQSLEEKIRDLNRSNKELEQFAYVASHDMNEPLRKITTFIERLNNKYYNELGEEGQLYLNRIVASAENMRRLIDTLLEFSRTTRHSQPFEMTDLNAILAQVVSDLELQIEDTGAVIDSDKLPAIEAVPSQMKQIFDNLLSNSIKFRKPGVSPHISIKCQRLGKKQKNEANLDQHKTFYRIDFSDNGIGFEPEYREKIFQIFQRLHGKAEYPGSGIGLAIAKKIADHMKGKIYATSEPGSGATFTLILPERQ